MNIRPLYDRIVVQVIEEENKTTSGLILKSPLPSTPRGKVLAAGAGHKLTDGTTRPLDVSVGDIVIYSSQFQEVKDEDGLPVLIMNQSNVLGIIEK